MEEMEGKQYMSKSLIVLIGLIIISCMNNIFDFKTEFEGPFHQLFVDHIRHHQIALQQ